MAEGMLRRYMWSHPFEGAKPKEHWPPEILWVGECARGEPRRSRRGRLPALRSALVPAYQGATGGHRQRPRAPPARRLRSAQFGVIFS
jgi:hypothetical protein